MFFGNSAKIPPVQISAVIITFNEAHNLPNAIESLKFADEVVVVDSGSTDRTRELAAGLGARVIENEWPGFSAQKQFATDTASFDWVLSIDADETVSPDLRDEIIKLRDAGFGADGYRIPRLSYYLGRPVRHSGWYPDRQLRLFDRRKGRWNGRVVHESVSMEPGAEVRNVRSDIIHTTTTSVVGHARMINERYAPLAAEQMFLEGRRAGGLTAILSGASAFIRSYFFRLGMLDGFPGLCIASFAAYHNVLKHLLLAEMYDRASSDKAGAPTTKQ